MKTPVAKPAEAPLEWAVKAMCKAAGRVSATRHDDAVTAFAAIEETLW